MKIRSGAVIVKNNSILLLYRFKNGQEYYVIPGGEMEANESPEETAVREIKEETNLNITLGKKFIEIEKEHYFLVESFNGEIKLGGPEMKRQSENNFYRIEWISLEKVRDLNLLPKIVKDRVLDFFNL